MEAEVVPLEVQVILPQLVPLKGIVVEVDRTMQIQVVAQAVEQLL